MECFFDLRKIAFEYYINGEIVTEGIRETVKKYASMEIIANQLVFYPVNLEAVLSRDKELFVHREYFYYFLAEAYCYYLEKSYRNLSINKLYSNWPLLSLIK